MILTFLTATTPPEITLPNPLATQTQCEYNINPEKKPEQYQMPDEFYICNQLIQQPCAAGSLSLIEKFDSDSNYAQVGCQFYDYNKIQDQCKKMNSLTPEDVLYNSSNQNFLNPYTKAQSYSNYESKLSITANSSIQDLCNAVDKNRLFILNPNQSSNFNKILSSLPQEFYNDDLTVKNITFEDLQQPPLKGSYNRIGSGVFIFKKNTPCDVTQSTWAAYNRMDPSTSLKTGSSVINTIDLTQPTDLLKALGGSQSQRHNLNPVNSHCFNEITKKDNTKQKVAIFYPLSRFENRVSASKYVSICAKFSEETSKLITRTITSPNPSPVKPILTPKTPPFLEPTSVVRPKKETSPKQNKEAIHDDVYYTPSSTSPDNLSKFINFIKGMFK